MSGEDILERQYNDTITIASVLNDLEKTMRVPLCFLSLVQQGVADSDELAPEAKLVDFVNGEKKCELYVIVYDLWRVLEPLIEKLEQDMLGGK